LSARLQRLARAGVIERYETSGRVSYALTPAGRELRPVIESIGRWGIRWMPELGDEDLDPHLLMWDIHRNVDLETVPQGRTVLRFTFRDVPASASDWWLVITDDGVDLCDFDPGDDVAATMESDLRILTQVWRGDLSWQQALHTGGVRLHGSSQARRVVPQWLKLSSFASVPRPD
jgi:hypothetical protein